MSVIGVETASAARGLFPPDKDPQPELMLSEKFMVTARSTTCKCIVTSVSTLDRNVQSLGIHQCRRDHDAVMKKLQSAAEFRVLGMIDCFEAGRNRG